jgi:rhodanese-related sulfurtransferase
MTAALITAEDLKTMMASEPVVVIDTRNPDAYAAGHIPGAVNVHDIFTYLRLHARGHGGTEVEIREPRSRPRPARKPR